MIFEQDMLHELDQIPELVGKVSMLIADEGTTKPFVVGAKQNIKFTRNLNGQRINTTAVYVFHVVAGSYKESQDMQDKVKDKLISFQQRPIGTNGTFVQSAEVEYLEDKYEFQPELYRATVRLTAII